MRDIVERLCERWRRSRDEISAEAAAEIERLQRDCAELYQVIGILADEAGMFDDLGVMKALDNADAAASGLPRPHDDLLPFNLGGQGLDLSGKM